MQLVVILLFNYPLSKHTLQLSCPIHQYPTKEKFYLVFFCYWDQIKQIILLPMSTSEQDRIIFYICSHQTIACMNKVKFLTILVATLFSCVLMNAQQLSWKRYTVNDGLIQSQTNTVYQDSKGYLWISTKLGISRFDGIHFVNYTEKDGLLGRWSSQITEDAEGNIWFLYQDGLSRFDGKAFVNFPYDAPYSKPYFQIMMPYSSDSAIIFQLLENNTLREVVLTNDHYSFISQIRFSTRLTNFFDIMEPRYDPLSNTLWLADNTGTLYSYKSGSIQKPRFKLSHLQGFQTGPYGNLYYLDDGSLYSYQDEHAEKLLSDAFSPYVDNKKLDLAIDKKGNIIVYYHDQIKAKVIAAKTRQITDISFPLSINVFFDREGNLWCCTENGLYRTNSMAFINYMPEKGGMNQNIWSVLEGKNEVMYFASYFNGLQRFANGSFSMVKGLPELPMGQPTYLAMGSITDAEKNIYLTTNYYPMIKYDGSDFTILPKEKEQIPSFIIRQSRYDSSFLIGAQRCFFRVHHNKLIDSVPVQPGNGKSTVVTGLEEDKYKRIWLGGFNGISVLIGDSLIAFPTTEFPFEYGGNALLRDFHDNLWIGNLSGLFFYDYHTFKKIENPLLNELVVTLITVGDSALYIGTIKGIVVLDLKRFYKDQSVQLTAIGPDKGFDAIEPGQNGFFQDSKGFLWLPNNDRVVRIDPAQIQANPNAPKVYITEVFRFGDQMNWLKVAGIDEDSTKLMFEHRDKNLRFEFIGISQYYPEGVSYSYMLEGFDASWSLPGKERNAVYTNLPPGDYRFLVKAANSDGLWSDNKAIMGFTIVPAIYQRLWFQIMGIVLAMLLLFLSGALVMYNIRRKQKREAEIALKMSELRLHSIHNQIDPHFTYNAINSIAAALLSEDRQTAYIYFVKLSKLMRAILKQNNQLTTTLEEEIDFVNSYVQIQQYRFKNQFDFELKMEDEVNLKTIIPKMCIQTFAENAIKHGLLPKKEMGKLFIHVFYDQDKLCLLIQDNGIGRKKAVQVKTAGTSNGLRIIDGYFDYFNHFNSKKLSYKITDLFDAERQVAGTSILILIPIDFTYQKL